MKRSKQNLKPWFDCEESSVFKVLKTFKKPHTVRMSPGCDYGKGLGHYAKYCTYFWLNVKRWKPHLKKKNQSPKMTSTSFLCYQRKLRMQRSGANERDLSMLICNRQGRWGCGQGDKDAGRGDTFPCTCEYCAQIWDPGTFFPKQSAVK